MSRYDRLMALTVGHGVWWFFAFFLVFFALVFIFADAPSLSVSGARTA